jgi:CDP-glucose 4,6-dehydratase
VRDYIYAEDAVEAYLFLAEHLARNPALRGESFNFSNESQITVVDLVRKIAGMMGSTLAPDVRNEASNEIRHQYLSAAKARRVLGWRPQFTLDTGLERTIAWYREFLAQDG